VFRQSFRQVLLGQGVSAATGSGLAALTPAPRRTARSGMPGHITDITGLGCGTTWKPSSRRPWPANGRETRAARWPWTFVARLPGQAHARRVDPQATAPTTVMRAALIRQTAPLLRLRTSASRRPRPHRRRPRASTPSTGAAAPCTAAPAARSLSSRSGHSTAAGLPAVRRRRPPRSPRSCRRQGSKHG